LQRGIVWHADVESSLSLRSQQPTLEIQPMPTRVISGRPCLNTKKGETSYIVILSDTEGDFSKDTKLTSVDDAKKKFQWLQAKNPIVSEKGKRLKVRIKTEKGHGDEKVDPPDTGDVTATITTPNDTTKEVPVDYIHEPP
jgi:hypothetical protein